MPKIVWQNYHVATDLFGSDWCLLPADSEEPSSTAAASLHAVFQVCQVCLLFVISSNYAIRCGTITQVYRQKSENSTATCIDM